MNNEPFKADPTRTFLKGDIVSPAFWQGREPFGQNGADVFHAYPCWKCVVMDDEKQGFVKAKTPAGLEFVIPACFLKLKMPIEKSEPFYITRDDEDGCYFVQKDDGETTAVDTLVQAYYFKTEDYNAHYYTEEQAEALANEACNRLNDEYRKEQERHES